MYILRYWEFQYKTAKREALTMSFRLILLLSIVLFISACGGAGDDATPATPISNIVPTVVAGTDQTVANNLVVTLSGAATDSDGSIASYVWSQVGGT
ncbi:MAG: putative lipoprotein YajG, partial [Oleispira sp.]